MADIGTKIYAALTGDSDVAALVGTRIEPQVLPQGTTLPAIVYTMVSGGPMMSADGVDTLENVSVQLDLYSLTYTEVRDLRAKVITALNSATAFKLGDVSETDDFDDDMTIRRVILRVSLWHNSDA